MPAQFFCPSTKAAAHSEMCRNNRRRMVQITDYEKQRFGSHKNIFRTIAFCGLGVLISVYLVNAGWGTIGKAGIVASIAMGCIFTMSSIYYNWWRSGMDWNRFNFGKHASEGAGGGSVWEHNKKALAKLYGDTKTAVGDIEQHAEDAAGKVSDAGQKVYGAATNVGGAAN